MPRSQLRVLAGALAVAGTIVSLLLAAGASVGAQERPPRLEVWDLALGARVEQLPDEFVDHGDPTVLLAHCGLDAKGISASILARFGARKSDASQPGTVVNIAKPAA